MVYNEQLMDYLVLQDRQWVSWSITVTICFFLANNRVNFEKNGVVLQNIVA